MKNQFTTWLNVLDYAPFYFEGLEFKNITKSKVWKSIHEAEAFITTFLKGYYNNFSTGTQTFYSVNRDLNSNPDFLFDTDYLEVTTVETLVYKIEFTSSTEFKVSPDIGPQVMGITSSDTQVGNLLIKVGAWQGLTFAAGDLIYLGLTHIDSMIADLTAKLAAAKLIQNTYSNETSGSSNDAAQLETKVYSMLKKLTDPTNPQLLSISRISIDLTPIPIVDEIDQYGNSVANYSDDEIGV